MIEAILIAACVTGVGVWMWAFLAFSVAVVDWLVGSELLLNGRISRAETKLERLRDRRRGK